MTDIHSCSYYCDRPACIKRQRDELREKMFGKGGMDDDEILLVAAQVISQQCVSEMTKQDWIAFARAIAAKEREACANVCESMRPSEQEYDQRFYTAATLCANAIRARGV